MRGAMADASATPLPRWSVSQRRVLSGTGAGSVFVTASPAAGLLVALGAGQDRLCRREPGDGDAERRARHVVEPDPLALVDRFGVAAVLAADPELEIGACRAALLDGRPHQTGDGVVERLERVDRQDPVLDVLEQEAALGVVTAVAEGHLGQVVGAEAEE